MPVPKLSETFKEALHYIDVIEFRGHNETESPVVTANYNMYLRFIQEHLENNLWNIYGRINIYFVDFLKDVIGAQVKFSENDNVCDLQFKEDSLCVVIHKPKGNH